MEQESIPTGGSSPAIRAQAGATFGRYRLLEKLGEGGMAAVFRAEVKGKGGFKKIVALKLVHPHLALQSTFNESFISEALLGGYLAHPNIVQTLDFGEHEGCLFIAMEYVSGRTLGQILAFHRERREMLPPDVAIQIAALIYRGLDYAHQARDHEGNPLRMVHRDLKPSNILIGGHGEVKIADFGVARAETNLSHTGCSGALKGTLGYMSPEQAWGLLNLDHRSDLFCAGILLFEMLTLLPLYEGRAEPLLIRRAQDAEVAPRLELLPDMPERAEVLEFLSRALARVADERFQSAGEMAEGLEQILERFPRRRPLVGWLRELDRRMSVKEPAPGGSSIDLGEFLVGDTEPAGAGDEPSLVRGGEEEGLPALWPEGLDAYGVPALPEHGAGEGGEEEGGQGDGKGERGERDGKGQREERDESEEARGERHGGARGERDGRVGEGRRGADRGRTRRRRRIEMLHLDAGPDESTLEPGARGSWRGEVRGEAGEVEVSETGEWVPELEANPAAGQGEEEPARGLEEEPARALEEVETTDRGGRGGRSGEAGAAGGAAEGFVEAVVGPVVEDGGEGLEDDEEACETVRVEAEEVFREGTRYELSASRGQGTESGELSAEGGGAQERPGEVLGREGQTGLVGVVLGAQHVGDRLGEEVLIAGGEADSEQAVPNPEDDVLVGAATEERRREAFSRGEAPGVEGRAAVAPAGRTRWRLATLWALAMLFASSGLIFLTRTSREPPADAERLSGVEPIALRGAGDSSRQAPFRAEWWDGLRGEPGDVSAGSEPGSLSSLQPLTVPRQSVASTSLLDAAEWLRLEAGSSPAVLGGPSLRGEPKGESTSGAMGGRTTVEEQVAGRGAGGAEEKRPRAGTPDSRTIGTGARETGTGRRAASTRSSRYPVVLTVEPAARLSVRSQGGREVREMSLEPVSTITLRLSPGEYTVTVDPGQGMRIFNFPLEVEPRAQECTAHVEQRQVECH